MAIRLTTRLAVALSSLLFAGALAAAASVEQEVALSPALHARALRADANTPLRASSLASALVTFRGGPITTASGETVDVRVSDSLPAETATPERWAEFLARLTHGPELAELTTYVLSFSEVQGICGSNALGCYGRDEMVVPGEVAEDVSPEEVVRHEYGHHVANHRLNAPWTAIDWGPKRWGSAANVCARVSRREAFPGDQGSNYARNPGEAWAETYRLMDERKVGITALTWRIIAPSFFPNDSAYQAAEHDVLQPWTAARTRVFTKTFGKRTRTWWIPVSTPLDGQARISATVPKDGTYDVALVGADRRTVIRRAQWVGQRVKRLETSICGQRSLFVRVIGGGRQRSALGSVRVSVTSP